MYGLIGKMLAIPGQRDALVESHFVTTPVGGHGLRAARQWSPT